MIDANQRWSLEQAERAIGELAAFDLAWIEEPLRADDLAAHVELRRRIEVPVALGENVHTRYRFAEFIDAGAVDLVQPNAVRVGGVTPFLRIADLAADRGVELAPHLLLELSAQLALALPGRHLVESVEDASFEALGALAAPSPVTVVGATASTTGQPGLGVRFSDELTDAAASVPPTEDR